MPRFTWRDLPTALDPRELTRLINTRMRRFESLFTGIVRIESGYRISRYLDLPVLDAAPDAPTDGARLFVVEVGGKDTLQARFPTGAVQTIATEP